MLALHLRLQRFGFAVFKGPQQLLDWGENTYEGDDPAALLRNRLASFFTMYAPSAVVIQGMPDREPERRALAESVKRQAAFHSADVMGIEREEMRETFGHTAKDDIAAHIVVIFPELAFKLPPRRKCWQSERHNMVVFDAVALGLTYFKLLDGSTLAT